MLIVLALWHRGGAASRRPAGASEAADHGRSLTISGDGWLSVGPPKSIPDKAAIIVSAPGGERIAVFRDGEEIGAVTNLCAHQNGPLGEGRIIDGCVTCPWHGYQYRLSDGRAPAHRLPKSSRPTDCGSTAARSRSIPNRSSPALTRRWKCPRIAVTGSSPRSPRCMLVAKPWKLQWPRKLARRRRGRRVVEDAAAARDRQEPRDRAVVQGRPFRRRLERLQSRRRTARRRSARRRLHHLPVAQLEIPPLHRQGRAGLRGGRGPGLRRQGRERPRAGRSRLRHETHQGAARAASVVPQNRAGARSDPARRHCDLADGRGQPALLRLGPSLDARLEILRRAWRGEQADPPERTEIPCLRGLLLEVGAMRCAGLQRVHQQMVEPEKRGLASSIGEVAMPATRIGPGARSILRDSGCGACGALVRLVARRDRPAHEPFSATHA